MQDILNYTFERGYYNTGNVVNVPEGSIIFPSYNVLYDSLGKLTSFRGLKKIYDYGGIRSFLLDRDIVGFLGKIPDEDLVGSPVEGIIPDAMYGNTVITAVNHPFIDGQQIKILSGNDQYGMATGHAFITNSTDDTFELSYTLNGPSQGFFNQDFPYEVSLTLSATNFDPAIATGNIIQGVGKSIWFVGNNGSEVRVMNAAATNGELVNIGGYSTVCTFTLAEETANASGSIDFTFDGAGLENAVTLTLPVENGTTTAELIDDIVTGLRANETIAANYYIAKWSPLTITIQDKQIRVNPVTTSSTADANISAVISGTITTQGGPSTYGLLSSTPQFCKWDFDNDRWFNPVQIGLSEVEQQVTLSLTPTTQVSEGFGKLIVGSRSVRVARKRYGGVSIASPPSNVVTAEETGATMLVTIPPQESDGSLKSDNTWLLYFTYKGQGSTATHKLFPIEVSEAELDGSEPMQIHEQGNAKYKVVKQHPTDIGQRIVEVEFYDNDLVLLEPYDDYYPLEPCRFLAKLGNVLCGIGTGDDSTGFDVSYPNNFEAFTPDWRDWFAEVPVSVAQEQDLGSFWICTANQSYLASWTGVTEGAAPVIIEKRSPLYGTIGEGSTACVQGLLYTLTKGKLPVILSPDGQVNIEFGVPVSAHFSTYDSNTQVSYDGSTNSVVFACKSIAIAYQINTGLWSAPITIGELNNVNDCLSMFPMNGGLFLCKFTGPSFAIENGFYTQKFNYYDTGDPSMEWNITSSFKSGQTGRALKDIIQVEAILSSETELGVIEFSACKNYDNGTIFGLVAGQYVTNSPSLITVRRFTESIDYDVISASISGDMIGQTVHNATYTVDAHRIERLN